MKHNNNHRLYCFLLFVILAGTNSCKKFIDVGLPETELASGSVFSDDESAIATMRGLYVQMQSSGGILGGVGSFSLLASFSADEMALLDATSGEYVYFASNELVSTNSSLLTLWQNCYSSIFHANSILEGIATSANLTDAVKKQLEGEAKFVRAFCHFYLVNFFGNVPLTTSTNYETNTSASRTPKEEVYQKIIADLLDAKNLMVTDYSTEAGQRIRPNKWAAVALLARVYLYLGQWENAELQASEVISQNSLYSLPTNLDNAFLKTSSEAIWQVMPVIASANTLDGNYFIVTANNPSSELHQSLWNAFEAADKRSTSWVSSYAVGTSIWRFPFKYKIKSGNNPLNEYYMVLRLAEQFLIRAEARTWRNNFAGAQSDINVIRARAFGSPNPTTANDKPSLLLAIEKERRLELFTEWGHRWLDLKRWNRATAVLGPTRLNWSVNDMLYPIPEKEIGINSNLKPQNPGY